jgi:exodeoxyribonuclease V alpha subunit
MSGQQYMNQSSVQLNGVLEKILFSNQENGYCVAKLSTGQRDSITVTGVLTGVQCGETLVLTGVWQSHPRFGRQFRIQSFRTQLPSSLHGLRKYLGSGLIPGIGPKYAEKIVDHFGEQTLEVLSNNSGRLREIPGIGKERAISIKRAWDEQQTLRNWMIFMQSHGIGLAHARKLWQRYGSDAPERVRSQPYRLAWEVSGIGFKTADKLALSLGFQHDGPERLQAGLTYSLIQSAEEGNTALPSELLLERTHTLLEVSIDQLRPILDEMIRTERLLSLPGTSLLQVPHYFKAENRIAHALFQIWHTPSSLPSIKLDAAIHWSEQRTSISYAPEQRQAIYSSLSNKICILTGGPGTGKTTLLRAVVSILKAKNVRITLASPTGRAARRLAESTGLTAQTIHRLLHLDPATGEPSYNKDKPLKTQFVIVDEVSMLDHVLAANLLEAIPAEAHLLLVGDSDQLPSVGPGNLLAELVQSRAFPVIRLQQVFRQGERSSIVWAAHEILRGNQSLPGILGSQSEESPSDLRLLKANDIDAIKQHLTRLLRQEIPTSHSSLDLLMDVQVLIPMHRGDAGISQMNLWLQDLLNPARNPSVSLRGFRTGDKVMQTRNHYEKQLFNGDVGKIEKIFPEENALQASFDQRTVLLENEELADLQLAYAVSVHKSQGSEYPIVIMLILNQFFPMLQRNLLYTGLTRGRRQVFLVGEEAAMTTAIRKKDAQRRYTGLGWRLQQTHSSPS